MKSYKFIVAVGLLILFSGCNMYSYKVIYGLGDVHEANRFDEVAVGNLLGDYIQKTNLTEYKSFNRMLEYVFNIINNPNPSEVKEVISNMSLYDIVNEHDFDLAMDIKKYIVNRLDIVDNKLTDQSARFVYCLEQDLLCF